MSTSRRSVTQRSLDADCCCWGLKNRSLHPDCGNRRPTTPGMSEQGRAATAIQGRSLRQIAWRRLKRDRVALAGGGVVITLILVAIFDPIYAAATGEVLEILGQRPSVLAGALLLAALGLAAREVTREALTDP